MIRLMTHGLVTICETQARQCTVLQDSFFFAFMLVICVEEAVESKYK